MLLSKKETNKLINFVDRYFTYDWRFIQSEGKKAAHYVSKDVLFTGHDYERHAYVSIDKGKFGTYVYICLDGDVLYSGYLKTFKEMKAFKAMIRCLG